MADYEKAAKNVGMLGNVKANQAYMEGYEGKADSVFAAPTKVGLGAALHEQYVRGKADKKAGRSPAPPFKLAEAVPIGARRTRKSKKTRKGKKAYSRRR